MRDESCEFLSPRRAGDRPLLGLTVLLVEDSRFSCEAVRLLCQRSGARLRRADCLSSARRHLQSYRPSVIIVDLGLPDGPGEELIAELAAQPGRIPVILGTSGAIDGEGISFAAGADGFLPKPVVSLAGFQSLILRHLGEPCPPRPISADDRILPDSLALRDDLSRAAEALSAGNGDVLYLAGFLKGIARSADDGALADAADRLAHGGDSSCLAGLLNERLSEGRPGF